MKAKSSNGNVLFLILIAVALFAALSYAVTKSSRGGGNNTNNESASVGTAQILQLISSYDTAILRLKANGCSAIQLNVVDLNAYPSMGRNFGNVNAPADGRCDIAKLSSTSAKINAAALDKKFAGSPTYGTVFTNKNFGITGVANYENSGFVIVPYVTDAACLGINKKLFGITAIPSSNGATNNYQPWDGVPWNGVGVFSCPSSQLGSNKCGDEMGCFKLGTFNDFHETTNTATSNSNVNLVYKKIIDAN